MAEFADHHQAGRSSSIAQSSMSPYGAVDPDMLRPSDPQHHPAFSLYPGTESGPATWQMVDYMAQALLDYTHPNPNHFPEGHTHAAGETHENPRGNHHHRQQQQQSDQRRDSNDAHGYTLSRNESVDHMSFISSSPSATSSIDATALDHPGTPVAAPPPPQSARGQQSSGRRGRPRKQSSPALTATAQSTANNTPRPLAPKPSQHKRRASPRDAPAPAASAPAPAPAPPPAPAPAPASSSASTSTATNNSKTKSPPPPSPIEVAGSTKEDKKARLRLRNRQAAHKCRLRKQRSIADLQTQEAAAEAIHQALVNEASMLRGEVLMLKSMILQHGSCECSYIQDYISSSAAKLTATQQQQQQQNKRLRQDSIASVNTAMSGPDRASFSSSHSSVASSPDYDSYGDLAREDDDGNPTASVMGRATHDVQAGADLSTRDGWPGVGDMNFGYFCVGRGEGDAHYDGMGDDGMRMSTDPTVPRLTAKV
ncbi:hypothetical protein ACRALDRAFT_2044251 [Sodiomyces alcalophilus JCM 7366]|uniref:uncharacterized protein n=1 Tax=Sodiomyces alcalophilus JCM 7366 TaxID=591952 RepID=UPI0039B697D8